MGLGNRVEFIVHGLNSGRALAKLRREDIVLHQLKRLDNRTFRAIASVDKKKLLALFEHTPFRIEVVREYGITIGFKNIGLRMGLGIGILIFMVVVGGYTSVIREIRIEGIPEREHEVREVLNELHVTEGSKGQSVNVQTVSKLLTAKLEGVALATVTRRGVVLMVNLIAADTTSPLPLQYADIIAKQSGVVTGVVVRSGTCRIKKGDTVKVGDILIEAKQYLPDGSYVVVAADGEVNGQFTVKLSEEFSLVTRQAFRTGLRSRSSQLYVFGKTFGKESSPESFKNVEKEVCEIFLFPNMILPIKRITTTWYELDYIEEVIDFDKVSKYVLEDIEKRLRAALPMGEVKSNTHTVERIPKAVSVTFEFVIEGVL